MILVVSQFVFFAALIVGAGSFLSAFGRGIPI